MRPVVPPPLALLYLLLARTVAAAAAVPLRLPSLLAKRLPVADWLSTDVASPAVAAGKLPWALAGWQLSSSCLYYS